MSDSKKQRVIHLDINLSVLLKEYPFLERFERARDLGFGAAEFYWTNDYAPSEIAGRVKAVGIQVAAFNFDAGDLAAGDRGLLCDPKRQNQMRENVPVALELANQVGCVRLTALAGNLDPEVETERQYDTIRENLRWVCEQAMPAGVTVLVEAINVWDNKLYPFTNTEETLRFLDSVGSPNLKYLYDVFHMQRMEGNLIETFEKNVGSIGHIQIADSPLRGRPGSGEINFVNLFRTIESSVYGGSVGLEYNPGPDTEKSLDWLPFDRRKEFAPDDLAL